MSGDRRDAPGLPPHLRAMLVDGAPVRRLRDLLRLWWLGLTDLRGRYTYRGFDLRGRLLKERRQKEAPDER